MDSHGDESRVIFTAGRQTVTLQLDVRPMFSPLVSSVKGRLMDLFSLCIAGEGSVKTVCRQYSALNSIVETYHQVSVIIKLELSFPGLTFCSLALDRQEDRC